MSVQNPTPRLLAAAAAGAALVAVLAGCGSDDSGGTAADPAGTEPTSASPSSSGSPGAPSATTPILATCDSVWVAGQRLPAEYQGCEQDGQVVKPEKHPCAYGSPIIEFDNHFYASAGKTINAVDDLDHDPRFLAAVNSCQA